MDAHQAITRLRQTRYSIEPEDCESLSGELEKSSNFEELCLEIAESAVEHELQAKAVAERINEMSERKSRLLRTSETLRSILLQSMQIRNVSTIKSPVLTLSVSNRKGEVIVTDESMLPSRFFKPQPPKLDKAALKEAVITDGEVIEGAAIGNGSIGLTIRRK